MLLEELLMNVENNFSTEQVQSVITLPITYPSEVARFALKHI